MNLRTRTMVTVEIGEEGGGATMSATFQLKEDGMRTASGISPHARQAMEYEQMIFRLLAEVWSEAFRQGCRAGAGEAT